MHFKNRFSNHLKNKSVDKIEKEYSLNHTKLKQEGFPSCAPLTQLHEGSKVFPDELFKNLNRLPNNFPSRNSNSYFSKNSQSRIQDFSKNYFSFDNQRKMFVRTNDIKTLLTHKKS